VIRPRILARTALDGGRLAVIVSLRPGHRVTVITDPGLPDALIAAVALAAAGGSQPAARHERQA
jgi:hypothetical protein